MTYSDYKKHIRAIFAEYGRQGIISGAIPVQFLPAENISPNEGGVIRAKNPDLIFRDGAKLKLYEEFCVVNNEIQRLYYSYHYERANGYFFRYEREETADPIRKPEYHLHVVLNLPHFNAPPVDLEIVLKLIVANFYSPDVYSKQIIAQEIHLIV